MRVAIVGSRSFNDYDLMKKTLDEIKDISLIVSGHAIGADTLGEKYAKEKGINTLIFIPDWEKWGKSSGYIRNLDIIKNSDCVICFWDGISKGSAHSISLAKKLGKELKIIIFDDGCDKLSQ